MLFTLFYLASDIFLCFLFWTFFLSLLFPLFFSFFLFLLLGCGICMVHIGLLRQYTYYPSSFVSVGIQALLMLCYWLSCHRPGYGPSPVLTARAWIKVASFYAPSFMHPCSYSAYFWLDLTSPLAFFIWQDGASHEWRSTRAIDRPTLDG